MALVKPSHYSALHITETDVVITTLCTCQGAPPVCYGIEGSDDPLIGRFHKVEPSTNIVSASLDLGICSLVPT